MTRCSYSELLDADDVFEGDEWYDEFDEDLEIIEEDFDDDFEDDLDDLMADMFDSLTPAESFNIGKALGTIGSGAAQALNDPTVRQIAATAAPVALGAAGTALGGPVSAPSPARRLGQAVGKALAPKPAAGADRSRRGDAAQWRHRSRPTARRHPPPRHARRRRSRRRPRDRPRRPRRWRSASSPTCSRACSPWPSARRGRSDINGIPVGAVMNMLASIYGKAAEDADELLYSSEGAPAYLLDADGYLRCRSRRTERTGRRPVRRPDRRRERVPGRSRAGVMDLTALLGRGLGEHLALAERVITQVVDRLAEDEMFGAGDESPAERIAVALGNRLSRLVRDEESSSARYEELVERNIAVASALGACDCWGENSRLSDLRRRGPRRMAAARSPPVRGVRATGGAEHGPARNSPLQDPQQPTHQPPTHHPQGEQP